MNSKTKLITLNCKQTWKPTIRMGDIPLLECAGSIYGCSNRSYVNENEKNKTFKFKMTMFKNSLLRNEIICSKKKAEMYAATEK